MARVSAQPAILFVCLGNICRSPLAEGALRAELTGRGLGWEVDSAGTGDWHVGNPPDPRAIAEAARRGVDIAGLRARQVAPQDFSRFTHIFALDEKNLADLGRVARPDAKARLSLLLDIVPGYEGRSVADPYFGDDSGFARTWDEVSLAARALVETL
ncbi:low molecular weight protein-tyrosine-phosphatase [Aurantiacibacter flavus]|uniref:protein-tyrosine-phosphatase n=1 Tax=Aurantiacibacter flavus TaxID=3145232 RepID=A0ABV0D0I5_9SPHN